MATWTAAGEGPLPKGRCFSLWRGGKSCDRGFLGITAVSGRASSFWGLAVFSKPYTASVYSFCNLPFIPEKKLFKKIKQTNIYIYIAKMTQRWAETHAVNDSLTAFSLHTYSIVALNSSHMNISFNIGYILLNIYMNCFGL